MLDKLSMKRILMIIGLALFSCHVSAASENAPTFEQYRVNEFHSGPVASARITTAHDRYFRTRLRYAARNGEVNFSGHYVLTFWGCGAECLMGAAIDAKTGRIAWVPFSVCCWPPKVDDPIIFRRNSSLVVFSGFLNEEGSKATHFYRFDGKQFLHIVSQPIETHEDDAD
ncbi:MAG: hypothetical protein FWF20_06065 [Betaproteobacteria bacterium]|nr:hypothetical protein [Betaproteobacteria bacterium]MCL2886337.1 hypothetical protein [Betaproteobacteria bacterium]